MDINAVAYIVLIVIIIAGSLWGTARVNGVLSVLNERLKLIAERSRDVTVEWIALHNLIEAAIENGWTQDEIRQIIEKGRTVYEKLKLLYDAIMGRATTTKKKSAKLSAALLTVESILHEAN